MDYSITQNPEYNSLEITFSERPSVEVRDALKKLRFRWHGQKKVWYGYAAEDAVRAAIEGKPVEVKKAAPAAANAYGVQVGDIFRSSWGYDQTNNDFFQVVELVGKSSVRVREVHPRIIERDGISWASEDRTLEITREMLPYPETSWYIKDQARGDLKRLQQGGGDGVPWFRFFDYHRATFCEPGKMKVYESWYA